MTWGARSRRISNQVLLQFGRNILSSAPEGLIDFQANLINSTKRVAFGRILALSWHQLSCNLAASLLCDIARGRLRNVSIQLIQPETNFDIQNWVIAMNSQFHNEWADEWWYDNAIC